jgi:arabinan endo-1,5-alpha-L-arabinosidase
VTVHAPRARHALVLLALVLAIAMSACGGDEGTPSSRSTAPSTAAEALEPVLDQDFPDPDILLVDGTYYAYATQPGDGSVNVQVATSTDLTSWDVQVQDPLPELPAWATNGRTWAPEVTKGPDGFLMYMTARSKDPDLQCIGVARSTSPAGPFRPIGDEPLVCPEDDGGAIDAASYVEPDGKRYLLWKNDGNCCGKDTWLHLQSLSADGLKLTGPPVRLIKQDQPWEGNLVEAPTLVRHGSSYVLFYSANDYGGESYTTGYATASKLEGPYEKAAEPLLTTAATGVTGPGGQDVVTDSAGKTHIVFHGWDPAVIYRGMYVADLTWDGATPVPDVG